MRMKREKTVVDVNLSEDQKNEMYMQLVKEQTIVNRRLSMEHQRHEDMVHYAKLYAMVHYFYVIHIPLYGAPASWGHGTLC